MRTYLLIPASLILTAVVGVGLSLAMGWNAHGGAMGLAGAVMIFASVAGVLPIVLARHASQAGMSQAALVGTMAHLFVAAAIVGVIVIGKLPVGAPFLYWSMAFYWATLAAVVAIVARAIRMAPPITAPPAPGKA